MLKTQAILFYDGIVVVRYIFIFWLKNPMAVNDDFWSRFLNAWILGLSAIVNFVYGFLPGTNLDPLICLPWFSKVYKAKDGMYFLIVSTK